MAEERKDNPKFLFKDIALGQSVELVLNSAKPVKTGEGNYGTWNLWFATMTNTKAREGRGANEKVIENYTGKVIIFPATKLNERLIDAANGSMDVKVKVTKTARETEKGLITEYLVEKVNEGRPVASSLSPTETKLVNEAKSLKTSGYDITLDLFIKASQEPQYENKITEEQATKLFKLINK